MKGQLDFRKVLDWYYSEEIVYATSQRERKALLVKISEPGFCVTVAGGVVWSGTLLETAVEVYNSITEKYTETRETFKL